MKTVKAQVLCIICAMFLTAAAGCTSKPAAEIEREKVVPVAAISAQREDLTVYQSFPGSVTASGEVNLTAKTGGVVEKVLVKEGDEVRKGDPVIILEQKDIARQLAQAQAGYNAAGAQLKSIEEGQIPQQITQLESSLKQAEANLKNVKENYDRMKGLYEEGAVTLVQFEGIELQYKVAEEQYDSTKTQLSLLEESMAPGGIAAAKAQVEQAEAMLSLAKSAFDNTVITSPTDGVVGAISVKEGQIAGPGVPVATVGNLDHVEINVFVSEERIGGISVGQSAQVTVDAAGKGSFDGTVTGVSPFKDLRTMLYPVKIASSNGGTLKSGMFARVKLATAIYSEVVTVPEDAVLFRGGNNVVFIVEDDKAKMVHVEVGAASEGKAAVKGVDPGALVVTEGQEMLQDGLTVSVVDRGSSK